MSERNDGFRPKDFGEKREDLSMKQGNFKSKYLPMPGFAWAETHESGPYYSNLTFVCSLQGLRGVTPHLQSCKSVKKVAEINVLFTTIELWYFLILSLQHA